MDPRGWWGGSGGGVFTSILRDFKEALGFLCCSFRIFGFLGCVALGCKGSLWCWMEVFYIFLGKVCGQGLCMRMQIMVFMYVSQVRGVG